MKLLRPLPFLLLILLFFTSCGTKNTEDSEWQKPKNVPKSLIAYLSKLTDDQLLFYEKKDLNKDGQTEYILAAGTLSDKTHKPDVKSLYLLHDTEGKITQIGDNLIQFGHAVSDISVIELQDMPGQYLLCTLTNDKDLKGFHLIGLTENEPETILYCASAIGVGQDILVDSDKDGKYDSYTSYRSGQDVLYYPTNRTYRLENNGSFLLSKEIIELPEYPDSVKETILQYLSLRSLDPTESVEAASRLKELCRDEKAAAKDFTSYDIYEALLKTINKANGAIDFKVEESSGSAQANLSFSNKDKQAYHYTVRLIKENNHWTIIEFIQ